MNSMTRRIRLATGIFGLVLLAMGGTLAKAAPSELLFSEYVEGSSYNRAVEIYNGTGAVVNLSTYVVEIYVNGSASATLNVTLSGTLADGDVYVITHSLADAAILAVADTVNGSLLFNGDDALVLRNGSAIVDVLGQVGYDPGSYWGFGNVSTQNNTLRRKAAICAADADPSDAFDPATEWDGFGLNAFDGLGTHVLSCALDYTPIYDIQYTTDPSGDSPLKDQVGVTTEGIVTAVYYNGYFIEDPAGGAWNGLYVYDSSGPAVGDRLRITGTVAEYYGLTELKTLAEYVVESSGNPLPSPVVLATGDVPQEQWESVLVRVENVSVIDDNLGYGEWSVSDGSGDVVIDDKGSYTYAPTNGEAIAAIIGPVDYAYGAFKIQPRDDNDIILPLDYTPIYDIQYTTDPSGDSPLKDQVGVTTEGIVTAVYYNGYFIEDPAGGAWNGLYVYDSSGPAVGDRLRITGTVAEYYGLTELKTLTEYVVESSGNTLPGPTVVSTGDVSQEQWESVLVRVENVVVTNEDLGYGEWSVSDGSGDVVIDDKGNYTYAPTNGEAIAAIIGPVDYAYGAFKIQPRDDDDIILSTQPGVIIVEKQTDPDGSTQSFEFSSSYGPNFSLADDETNNSGPLTPGIYSVSEVNLPPNWSLIAAACDDGSDPSAIGLDAGETVTCTFTNSCDDADQDGACDNADNCPDTPNPDQTDGDGDGIGDACDICPAGDDNVDSDGDGVPDACDICPGGDDNVDSDGDGVPDACDECSDSDVRESIVIGDCDTGVPNLLIDGSCSMADLIGQCASGAKNHGAFVKCVARLTNDWKRDGLISGKEKGRIQSCAAKADLP